MATQADLQASVEKVTATVLESQSKVTDAINAVDGEIQRFKDLLAAGTNPQDAVDALEKAVIDLKAVNAAIQGISETANAEAK